MTVDVIASFNITEPPITQRLTVIMLAAQNFFLLALTTQQQKEDFEGVQVLVI